MNKFFQPEADRLTVTERYRVARAMIREAYLTPAQLINLESYDIPPAAQVVEPLGPPTFGVRVVCERAKAGR